MSSAFLGSPLFLEHESPDHPETPLRLLAIQEVLQDRGLLNRLVCLESTPATEEQILAVHSPRLLGRLHGNALRGGGYLDGDTYMNERSLPAAYLAPGAVISGIDAVMAGNVDNAFALVRPPGHHATRDQSMGFCLINNVAVAAQYALERYKLERVLVIDFDVHHGNGTQDIFYDTSRVLYFSSHRYPFYPGTGHWHETGEGEGEGFTVNAPLPQGVGDEMYARLFDQLLYPVAERYHPQLVLVSAGYDAHWADPLGALTNVSVTGFAYLVKVIQAIANDLSEGHVVYVLEGGYDLDALALSVAATFQVLLHDQEISDPLGGSQRPERDIRELIDQYRGIQRLV